MKYINSLPHYWLSLLVVLCLLPVYSQACTIFLLTDKDKTLFFSNEDYTNPNTFMWFIPGGKDYYGCAFVGFDNGQAQGGFNTEGLAFDWWAGGYAPYEWDSTKPRTKGSSSQRMLESCKTVDEAIEFYQTYAEPSFANATIFIADKTGASVIIGSRNGKLFFDKSNESRVLGAGESTFEEMFSNDPSINMEHGTNILKQCVTTGAFATKYSHIFDLRTGDISLYRFETEEEPAQLNLSHELQKGSHHYEIPRLKEQLGETPKELFINMKRLVLFDYEELKENSPKAHSIPLNLLGDLSNGTINVAQYAPGIWTNLEEEQAGIKSELDQFGKLEHVHAIRKEEEGSEAIYYYVAIYEHGRILWKFRFNSETIVQDLQFRAAAITG